MLLIIDIKINTYLIHENDSEPKAKVIPCVSQWITYYTLENTAMYVGIQQNVILAEASGVEVFP